MYWYGIMIRCGEQLSQTTLPHFLPRNQSQRRFSHFSAMRK